MAPVFSVFSIVVIGRVIISTVIISTVIVSTVIINIFIINNVSHIKCFKYCHWKCSHYKYFHIIILSVKHLSIYDIDEWKKLHLQEMCGMGDDDGEGVCLRSSSTSSIWAQCHKTFHARNLLIFIISYSVCPSLMCVGKAGAYPRV